MVPINVDGYWLRREYVENRRHITDIAKQLGCHPNSVRRLLRQHDIPRRGHFSICIDLVDKRFGKLVVKKYIDRNKYSCAEWECLCDCGKTTIVPSSALRGGLTTSCGCYRKELMFKGCGDLSLSYWSRVLKGAKKRGLEVSITIEDAWEQYLKQEGKCALSGVSIVIVRDYTTSTSLHTASLDRIDSTKGYIRNNIQWVHRVINIAKNNLSDKEFVKWCSTVVEYQSKKQEGCCDV